MFLLPLCPPPPFGLNMAPFKALWKFAWVNMGKPALNCLFRVPQVV